MAPVAPPFEMGPSTPLLSQTESNSSTSSTPESCSEASDAESPPSPYQVKLPLPSKALAGFCNYREMAVLNGHTGPISSLALCGEFVLSASEGKDMIVWQQPDLKLFAKFGQGDGATKSIVTVGNKVFSAHQDSKIRVWKISRSAENVFKIFRTLPTRKDYLGMFMKKRNYVPVRRHHRKLWIEHADAVSCLSISNGILYSGSWDKSLKVWRISDLKCLESIKAHDDAINGLVACKGVVYSGSADGRIKAWGKEGRSPSSKHCLRGILEGQKGVSMNSLVASEDGRWVYGGQSNGFILGWEACTDLAKWKLVCQTKAHDMAVLCMCLKGRLVCSGSADRTIAVWRRLAYGGISKVGVIAGHGVPVKCLQASPNSVGDGFLLYSGGFDKSLRVWWVPNQI